MFKRLFHEGWICWPVRRGLPRAAFLLVLSFVVLPFGYITLRIGAAATFGALGDPADVRRAIFLDPANPGFYERLGQIDQSSLEPTEAQSIQWYRKAVALAPANGVYWENLGQACQFAGDARCSADAFARALFLNAKWPQAFWLAANDDLLAGSADKAMALFRRLLQMDSDYAEAVFAICLRAYNNPNLAGEDLLPAGSSAQLRLAYVSFLAARNDFQSAGRFWSELVSAGEPFDFSLADPYLESLIASGRIAQAAQVWEDLRHLGILPSGGAGPANNLVFDSDFERNPLNAGFDWRFRNLPGIETEFADPSAHQGARCLRIDFVVPENQASEPVYQFIPVSGGQTYSLTAWFRSQAITSSSGPRLRVIDAQHPSCLQAETEAAVGTTAWHQVNVTFTACHETQLVRLSVWRPRSGDFPSAISGHFWLDDVALEPQRHSQSAFLANENR